MAISAPIDATKTPAWVALQKHHDELVEKGISLKDWFAADPDRVEKLSYRAGDLYFDLSKNLVTDETLKLLVDLGRACGVEERDVRVCSHLRRTHMAISAPIDATKTPAWVALQKHHDELVEKGISLKDWFAADPDRVEKLSYRAGDLYFDLSKNLVTDETLKLLVDLGRACGVEERRDAMFSGEHINTTEDRAVLHTALRRPASQKGELIVDGQDVVADVHEVLDRMYAFADRVRSGEWKGVSGKKIEHVVSIGIGGSDLGPVMVYEAMKPYLDAGIDCRYISNIDPNDMAEKVKGLDAETTLVIIVSHHRLQDVHHARDAHQRP